MGTATRQFTKRLIPETIPQSHEGRECRQEGRVAPCIPDEGKVLVNMLMTV